MQALFMGGIEGRPGQYFDHRDSSQGGKTLGGEKTPTPFTALIQGAEANEGQQGAAYTSEDFDKVSDKLCDLLDDFPSSGWHSPEELRDTFFMVWFGFRLVSYEHLGGASQAVLQDNLYSYHKLYEQHTEEFVTSKGESVNPEQRIFSDRMELTYQQAKIVEHIVGALNQMYDPGGEVETPENKTKRTFYYDDFIGRALPKMYGRKGEVLPFGYERQHEDEIKEYVRKRERKSGILSSK